MNEESKIKFEIPVDIIESVIRESFQTVVKEYIHDEIMLAPGRIKLNDLSKNLVNDLFNDSIYHKEKLISQKIIEDIRKLFEDKFYEVIFPQIKKDVEKINDKNFKFDISKIKEVFFESTYSAIRESKTYSKIYREIQYKIDEEFDDDVCEIADFALENYLKKRFSNDA